MSVSRIDPSLIENLPPSLLETLPAAQPPPGVVANFANPPTRVPAILGIGITFLVLALFCWTIRIYTKAVISKAWRWDDVTCSLGFACSIVYFAGVVVGCFEGDAGRHLWDLHLDQVIGIGSFQQNYLTTALATLPVALIKASFFIQYYQLFRPLRWMRICVWVGATLSALFYIPIIIISFVLTSPWPGESWLDDLLSWHYTKLTVFNLPIGTINMLVDWYLLILPIPAVLTLHISTAKKLGVLTVFLTGALATVASTVGLYYRVKLEDDLFDVSWNSGFVLMLSELEMFTGVAASCMPTVHHFFVIKDLSRTRWGHLRSFFTQIKSVESDSASFGPVHSVDMREQTRMMDLESNGYPLQHPRIHLTREFIVGRE